MRNCCGPFKRGKPAKAVNPNQQCFADCCGNLCPPDGCCDTVKIEYQCGCGCDCEHKGFNFSGLKFKKKSRRRKIPKFSKKSVAENGFSFGDGTIPGTIPVSSSSTSGEPSSTSGDPSSSSSSCECGAFQVEISTDGCCLYLTPGGIEAVGDGTITATPTNVSLPPDCAVDVTLNGEATRQIQAKDGDLIVVGVSNSAGCECCEVYRDCSMSSSSLWVRKNEKEINNFVLDRESIREKVRIAVDKVRRKRKN
jgi:hypothetical protein